MAAQVANPISRNAERNIRSAGEAGTLAKIISLSFILPIVIEALIVVA
ncbi:hypothetical protein P4S68_04395 [Pseudoalteromonas sp. Hal099]